MAIDTYMCVCENMVYVLRESLNKVNRHQQNKEGLNFEVDQIEGLSCKIYMYISFIYYASNQTFL